MTYSQLLQRLFSVNLHGGMKLGLQNVEQLQQHLHYPDRHFTSVHVAGTNGKGSVATKIACAFQSAGYTVGLYTSPHLSSFRERIRVNGQMISEQEVETLLSSLFHLVEQEKIPATFFELTTFLAFQYFVQKKVDIAILETGLGGRLDATNIMNPCLSVITSISLDHTEILGKTREEIAYEKAGIIKENIPVVIGPHVPLEPIQEVAFKKQSPCIQVKGSSEFFEEENCLIAQAALAQLAARFHLSPEAIKKGLQGKQPCRFEILKGDPVVILDVAHNPDGLKHLFQAIQSHFPDQSFRLLFGLSKSKDILGCLRLISAFAEDFHIVEATNSRGASVNHLYTNLCEIGVDATKLFMHESIKSGVSIAQEEAKRYDQILVICGSFFIMCDARQALGFNEPCDVIDLNERLTSFHLA